jgi:hypothetical protein
MVIDDLDVVGITVAPTKADPPLIVNSNAVLSFSIARKAFKPIAGGSFEIIEAAGVVYLHQFSVRNLHDDVRDAFQEATLPCGFRHSIPKRT